MITHIYTIEKFLFTRKSYKWIARPKNHDINIWNFVINHIHTYFNLKTWLYSNLTILIFTWSTVNFDYTHGRSIIN